jgi:hypothetical protein
MSLSWPPKFAKISPKKFVAFPETLQESQLKSIVAKTSAPFIVKHYKYRNQQLVPPSNFLDNLTVNVSVSDDGEDQILFWRFITWKGLFPANEVELEQGKRKIVSMTGQEAMARIMGDLSEYDKPIISSREKYSIHQLSLSPSKFPAATNILQPLIPPNVQSIFNIGIASSGSVIPLHFDDSGAQIISYQIAGNQLIKLRKIM